MYDCFLTDGVSKVETGISDMFTAQALIVDMCSRGAILEANCSGARIATLSASYENSIYSFVMKMPLSDFSRFIETVSIPPNWTLTFRKDV